MKDPYEYIADILGGLVVGAEESLNFLSAEQNRLLEEWSGVGSRDFFGLFAPNHIHQILSADTAGETPNSMGFSVTFESAEIGKSQEIGADWVMVYGFAKTPFGTCLMAECPRGICHLSFFDKEEASLSELQKEWPASKWMRDDALIRNSVEKIFSHKENSSGMKPPIFVRGTEFQVKVWKALLDLPQGSLTSYGRLAKSIGNPSAARAVGSAVGKNPISYLIPCHRVIRETAVLGDYRWGSIRKMAMIGWELARK